MEQNSQNDSTSIFTGSSFCLEYTFQHPIDKVWNRLKYIRDFKSITGLFTNFMLFEKNFGETGCIFSCDYNGFFTFKYQVTEIIDEPFYKKITVESMSSDHHNYKYQMEFSLFKLSSNNTCYLNHKFQFLNGIHVSEDMLSELKYDKLNIFRENNKILFKERQKKIYEQTETCIISKNKPFLWELVKNFDSKFCTIVKGVADEVIIDDKELKLHTKVTFNYTEPKFSISFFVTEVEEEQDQKIWRIKMSSNNENQNHLIKIDSKVIKEEEEYYTPEQEILFELKYIDQLKSMLIFKHLFKKRVNLEKLQILSENKLKMLEQLKDFCENL